MLMTNSDPTNCLVTCSLLASDCSAAYSGRLSIAADLTLKGLNQYPAWTEDACVSCTASPSNANGLGSSGTLTSGSFTVTQPHNCGTSISDQTNVGLKSYLYVYDSSSPTITIPLVSDYITYLSTCTTSPTCCGTPTCTLYSDSAMTTAYSTTTYVSVSSLNLVVN